MLNSWFPAIVYSPQYLLRKDGIYSMHELIAIPIVTVQLKNYLMNRLAFTSSKSTNNGNTDLLKVNSKDTRKRSLWSLVCIHC